MGKVLKSWSGMRNYLEKEMLAKNLYGRVRYNCTRYVGMDHCHIFEVFIDNKLVKQFSWETVNSYFIANHYFGDLKKRSPLSLNEYWEDYWRTLKITPMNKRTEYTDDEFCEALRIYRNHNINESILSENPIVRMFAILDRRLGKRTLEVIKGEINEQIEWLQFFYKLRLYADGVIINKQFN